MNDPLNVYFSLIEHNESETKMLTILKLSLDGWLRM